MPVSQAAVTPVNMELSPCRVTFNGVDLGGTKGNVKVVGAFKKADLKADQSGDTILDRFVSGFDLKVETVLLEVKDKDIWKVVYPNAKKISAGNGAMYFESAIGQKDSSLSAILLLHPLSIADASLDFDHKFYKAVAESVSEVTFGPTEQQGLKIVWHILPDTSVIPWRFWFHGDPANGVVLASAGAPSYTGTGNGAISAVTAYSGFTKTETITVSCLGVPGSNASNWYVSGSVSGPLGSFSVLGVGGYYDFTCPHISFRVTDGTIDFVLNDNWTIATVAANYA